MSASKTEKRESVTRLRVRHRSLAVSTSTTGIVIAAAVVGAAVVDVGAAEVDEEDEVVDEEVVDEAVEEVVEALEWRFSTLTPQQQKIII